MNSDCDAEIDNEAPIKTVTFSNALHRLETVKTYLMQQDVNDAIFSPLHKVQKRLFRVENQKDCQTSISNDEAHFSFNGYVNKQNCRIWSEANPQVYVETPLHPEKLTVWCALWAGGILLQKR
ncbi:hypothetical protein TNCV_195141 [Trichonephila clavipes]|uniref:Uncharacterized protein n=1 Tax=Trichonephila clavipes TaxID=2585209 RepID=A0A8X6WJW2_TRICX|nr:hypothetical protein TNCV_195141 [Trichonephila clavipes]